MAVVFKSGDLRRRMIFQKRSTSQDAIGGQSTSWTDAFTAWVYIQALSGHELFAAQSVHSDVTHAIYTRYRSDFFDPKAVAAMRGIYNGRYFNFRASMNIEERNKYIQIMADEGLNDG